MIANQTNTLVDATTNRFNGSFSTNYAAAYGAGPSTNSVGLYLAPASAATVPLSSSNNSYSEFTYSTWFRYPGVNTLHATTQVASGADSETNNWSLYIDANGVAHVALADAQGAGTTFSSVATNESLLDGQWHMLASVVQTNSVELYVDFPTNHMKVEKVDLVRQPFSFR